MAGLGVPLLSTYGAQVEFVQNAVNDADGSALGAVASDAWQITGPSYTTVTAPAVYSSYRFAYWSVSSCFNTIFRDSWGRSLNPVSFILLEDTTATAHYLPATRDADADGIPDWYEMEYYGTLTNSASYDGDGDGITLAQEYSGGTSPLFAESTQPGGVFWADSGSITCNLAGYSRYVIRSEPMGTVYQSAIVVTGTVITTSSFSGNALFGYWALDGVRQQDAWGVAYPRVTFTVQTSNRECVAYLFTGDTDGDGVPDAYEQYYYGTLTNNAASDTDGDGFTLAQEYANGTSPLFANSNQPGGVFWADSTSVTCNLAGYARYVIRSEPTGTVYQSAIVATGTVITTPSFSGNASFGYWTLDGVRQQDAWGVAYPQIKFTVSTNNREAVVYLFTGDSDGDGIPDAYEQYIYGTLTNAAASDTDGDGFTLAQEYSGGTSPFMVNSNQPGGVFWADSGSITCNLAGYSCYIIRSEPTGTIYQSAIVTTGTVITTPSFSGSASFGYWTVDGVRQQDAWGVAYPQVSFTVQTNDREAVVHLFTGDSDGDGIPDAYEQYYFGTLTNNASSDTDGDGFTLAQEYANGTSPLFANSTQPGGVFWQDSSLIRVNLQMFDRSEFILVGGIPTRFFSPFPTNMTIAPLGLATAPALGDWDGDGDLDLFVGGSNGTMRVYENTGSPVVPNLVERTSNFISLAWAWSNIGNPAAALGDWSGDGKADLAIGGSTGMITLVSSTGNFASPQQPAITSFLYFASSSAIPALADTTGDGRADLFVLLGDGTVNLYTNTGNALAPFDLSSAQSNILGLAVSDTTGIAAADVDENGTIDILISDMVGRIWDFRRYTDGTYNLLSKVYAGSYAGFANRLTLAAGDFDGDGDSDLICGFAEGGLIYLRNPSPRLLINPPTTTLIEGQQVTFGTLNSAGQIAWTISRNASGGSIVSNSGVYTAGTTGQGMDTIRGIAPSGLRGLAYVNVISTNDVASFGKAVVIAGGRSLDDPVWLASDYIGNRAYNVLRYKGYSKENIQYLSLQPGRDIDGNGLDDDIDGYSSFSNTATTFTNWVGNANKLFVYLVDHGSSDTNQSYFRLNTGENVSATQLNAWLTSIQNKYQTEVLVVMDFCYSGNFLPFLAYPGPAKRTVIAATSPDELTYFLSGGSVSFSDLFLSGLLEGMNPLQAFNQAQDGMSAYQNATLDDNGNGLCEPGIDGAVAAQFQVGASQLAGKDVPVIGAVADSQTLVTGTRATLWAGSIQSYYPLSSVSCSILPPTSMLNTTSGIPVTSVPELQLAYDSPSQAYTAIFDGFTEQGLYKINYYARDIWGSVSPPRQGFVTQAGYDERMIIVAGGTINDGQTGMFRTMAGTVYQTALARRIGCDHILYLSPVTNQDLNADGTNDVWGLPTMSNLSYAFTTWAAGAKKVSVYLTGPLSNNLLRLNAAETLAATNLALMINGYQTSNRSVNVIMEFDGSGSYIPALASTTNGERIVMASTKAGAAGTQALGGLVSFSQYFWNAIFNGNSIGSAFSIAQNIISTASGRLHQTAQLDDNGNGIANEKKKDGNLAAIRYIGSAFVTGDDTPYIGQTIPGGVITPTNQMLIWAGQILDVTGISNVWCVMTAPDYNGTDELQRIDLAWNPGNNRYEATITNLTQPGVFALTFQAINNAGILSSPAQTIFTLADAYETDDTATQASNMDVGDMQTGHNFHTATDEDWTRFYLPATGKVFRITATQQGTNIDLGMDIYFERPDGTLSNIYLGIDDAADGIGEHEQQELNFVTDTTLQEGFYLVRIYPAVAEMWGVGSAYDLSVMVPSGGGLLIVAAIDKLANPSKPPASTRVVLDNNDSTTLWFGTNTSVSYGNLSAGNHTVRVDVGAAGYMAAQDSLYPNQANNPNNANFGNPRTKTIVESSTQVVTFQFMPVITAQGVVRDQLTGEYVSGAKIAFIATSGLINTQVYDGYPNSATYKNYWYTQNDGTFPGDVILPTANWNLLLTKGGYVTNLTVSAIASPVAGQTYSQAVRWMIPVDSNGNQIADSWEQQYFGTNTVVATADSDHDGQNNLNEYRSGTNPTNASSVFRASQAAATNHLTLVWSVAPGRSYQVEATLSLSSGAWSTIAGPWTATNGQTTMQCSPSMTTSNQTFRVRMSTP